MRSAHPTGHETPHSPRTRVAAGRLRVPGHRAVARDLGGDRRAVGRPRRCDRRTRLGTRPRTRHVHGSPQGVYACPGIEQWLVISVETDEQWAGLVDAIGAPDWARDPALATYTGRRRASTRARASSSGS